ncbi:FG-GAP repeat domain-containing protein [Anaerosphaera multitolerans]|uniref:FG-GAP repeat domain-containing protein n=1 Tax=Anaerosphaera multitolerans TaxID=2487351 RepID=UPI0013E34DD9|nr:VCBS repeat-containing protein [Anaerosphaera multitolerans]
MKYFFKISGDIIKKYILIFTLPLILLLYFLIPKTVIFDDVKIIQYPGKYSITIKDKTPIYRKGQFLTGAAGDINGDGFLDIALINKKFFSNRGSTLEILSPLKNSHTLFKRDLSQIKPWKVSLGDVTGDGVMELAIGVEKTSPHHNIMAKRCFFYNLDFDSGKLIPRYRASRFARPLEDYILYDIDKDGTCEVMSIEYTQRGKVLSAYKWSGFGFKVEYSSREYKNLDNFQIINSKLCTGEKEVFLEEGILKIGG